FDDSFHAVAVRYIHYFFQHIFSRIVNRIISTDRTKFVIVPGKCNRFGTVQFSDLDGGRAYSASSADNQNGFPAPTLSSGMEHLPSRCISDGHRCARLKWYAIRNRHNVRVRNGNIFRIAPMPVHSDNLQLWTAHFFTRDAITAFTAYDPRYYYDSCSY